MTQTGKSRRGDAVWTVLDQVIVSAGNFLLNIALARRLPPTELAVFALIFLGMLALNTFHSGLVVYWLNVSGAKADAKGVRPLLTTSILTTLELSLLFAPIAWGTTHLLGRDDLWGWMLLATVTWQLQETARRGLLCQMRARHALAGDAISYLGQVLLLILLGRNDVRTGLQIIAATSIVAATLQFSQTGLAAVQFREAWLAFRGSLRVTKYAVGANFINMAALQIPGWTLLHAGGKLEVASYQAMLSIANAANPIFFAVTNFVIPSVARVSHRSIHEARKVATWASLQISSPLLLLFGATMLFPHQILQIVYGSSSPYLAQAGLLRWFYLAAMLQWIAVCVGAYEGGMGRTKSYFMAQLLSVIVLATAGILLITRFGTEGAVAAAIFASSVRAITTFLLSRRSDQLAFSKASATHNLIPEEV